LGAAASRPNEKNCNTRNQSKKKKKKSCRRDALLCLSARLARARERMDAKDHGLHEMRNSSFPAVVHSLPKTKKKKKKIGLFFFFFFFKDKTLGRPQGSHDGRFNRWGKKWGASKGKK
jgi:hypothetical protein